MSSEGDEGRAVAVAVPLGAVAFRIAELAVDLTVGSVVSNHGIERTVALAAIVASLVPFLEKELISDTA